MSMTREELRDSARKAFGEAGLAPDAATSWQTLAEMGWFMMTAPEELGGLGLGYEALAAIHYELGRALVPGPAIAQSAAIEALVATGRTEMLERAMTGEKITVSRLGFMDADEASSALFLSPDRTGFGSIGDATHRPTWDETRRLFAVGTSESDQVPLDDGLASGVYQRAMSAAYLAIAADSLGGADAILEMTVDYLKTRRQFDRPLAMFQALKHRVADLKVQLEAAQALLWARATGTPTLAEAGALKAFATATYCAIAEEAIQLHGGIGLTAEHHCHRFLKRALLNAALGDDNDTLHEATGRALMETYA
ncbi:acyl-CoA dehydrogenase family protein [Sphingomonas sp. SUN039]|uniref:acyl-CoA dehydrogenase family protein n=1 Tax=Sphingomonas sp. SUN039 TaxID=2937787 RepID=UPI002164DEDE|nr:acyl-CoA dehydrogenase family protein [Sphingomonas sp. SUN039]UVO54272.1 acyl-CoA/acyl-ACP dehydrogenase [Sphingomonas sp. SUN039]